MCVCVCLCVCVCIKRDRERERLYHLLNDHHWGYIKWCLNVGGISRQRINCIQPMFKEGHCKHRFYCMCSWNAIVLDMKSSLQFTHVSVLIVFIAKFLKRPILQWRHLMVITTIINNNNNNNIYKLLPFHCDIYNKLPRVLNIVNWFIFYVMHWKWIRDVLASLWQKPSQETNTTIW